MQKEDSQFEDSLKSRDTEEWTDIRFYRPLGYRWALLAKRLGISPNQITVAAIFIGAAAGICFYFTSIKINIVGILLLVLANSFDSADGQLARITGRKTELGRILDGICGDIWFLFIYIAIVLRLWQSWGFWILATGVAAGVCHHLQAATADCYRNVYLHFLKGKNGDEWEHSENVRRRFENLSWQKHTLRKIFELLYLFYTKNQETATPALQRLRHSVASKYAGKAPDNLCRSFCRQSHTLLKYTNILSFNTRSFALFAAILINKPWIFFVFELTFLNILLIYMLCKYDKICKRHTV